MKRIKQIISLAVMALLLNACSSMGSEFECPMKPGVRCESLDQVYDEVNRGEIGKTTISTGSHHEFENMNVSSPSYFKDSLDSTDRTPLRYGETVMRVWVAPFEDTAGNYHQESDIYTVVKPAHWIGFPPKELNSSEK